MTGGEAAVTVPGETIGQVIDHLDERYPGIKGRLCQGDRLRPNIAVVVDGEMCRSGLQHRLIDTSEVCFLPALSGGVIGIQSAVMSAQRFSVAAVTPSPCASAQPLS
jgi:molybdopterin synthase sulfur carrier subunit